MELFYANVAFHLQLHKLLLQQFQCAFDIKRLLSSVLEKWDFVTSKWNIDVLKLACCHFETADCPSLSSSSRALLPTLSPAVLHFWCKKIEHNFRIGPLSVPIMLCCLLGCQRDLFLTSQRPDLQISAHFPLFLSLLLPSHQSWTQCFSCISYKQWLQKQETKWDKFHAWCLLKTLRGVGRLGWGGGAVRGGSDKSISCAIIQLQQLLRKRRKEKLCRRFLSFDYLTPTTGLSSKLNKSLWSG